MFVVELSNPYHSDGGAYERWELDSAEALVDRLESETGWSRAECWEAAVGRIIKGGIFEDECEETGRTVTAKRVERVGAVG